MSETPTLQPTGFTETIFPTSDYTTLPPVTYTSSNPTSFPTASPIPPPTFSPTFAPSPITTFAPSHIPTFAPSHIPTFAPTRQPSSSKIPTVTPSSIPTLQPSSEEAFPIGSEPTLPPQSSESFFPTLEPSYNPADQPTSSPTASPTLSQQQLNEIYARQTYRKYEPSDIVRFGKSFTLGEDIALPLHSTYLAKTLTIPLVLASIGFFFILLLIIYLLMMRFQGRKMFKVHRYLVRKKKKNISEENDLEIVEIQVQSPISSPRPPDEENLHLASTSPALAVSSTGDYVPKPVSEASSEVNPFQIETSEEPAKKSIFRSRFLCYPTDEFSKRRRMIVICCLGVFFAVSTTIMFIVISVKVNQAMLRFYDTLDEIQDITSSLMSNVVQFKSASLTSMQYFLQSLGMRESDAERAVGNGMDPDDFMDLIKNLIGSGLIDRIFNPNRAQLGKGALNVLKSLGFPMTAGMESVRSLTSTLGRSFMKKSSDVLSRSGDMTSLLPSTESLSAALASTTSSSTFSNLGKYKELALNICLSTRMTALGTNVTIISSSSGVLEDQLKPLGNFVDNSNDVVHSLNLHMWIPLVYSFLAAFSLCLISALVYSQWKQWSFGIKFSIAMSVLFFYFLCTVSALILFVFTLSSDICMDPLTFVIENMKNNEIVEDTIRYLTKCYGSLPVVMTALNLGVDTVSGMQSSAERLMERDCSGMSSIEKLNNELIQLNGYTQGIKTDLNCMRLRTIWNDLLYGLLCTDIENALFATWLCTLVSGFFLFCLMTDLIITNYDGLLTLYRKNNDIPVIMNENRGSWEECLSPISRIVVEKEERKRNKKEAKTASKGTELPEGQEVEDEKEEEEEDFKVIVEVFDDDGQVLKDENIKSAPPGVR